MGNLMEKQEEEKEQQKEHMESLDKDEIPPDTQVSNDQVKIIEKEESQDEAKEENQVNEQVQEEAAKQAEENNEEEHGEEAQGEEGQKYQIIEDEERGRLYQYEQNGKIYQVDERGQLYQVIQEGQEEQEGQEGQEEQIEQQQQYQLNQGQVYQYNQGGQAFQTQQQYQIYQQGEDGHQYQSIPTNQFYQMNQQNQGNYSLFNQQNYQSQIQSGNKGNTNYQMVKASNSSYIANEQKSKTMGEKLQDKSGKMSKNRSKPNMQRKIKRSEPRDSNPKVHIIYNKGRENDKSNLSMNNFNRSGFTKKNNMNFRMNNTKENRSFQKMTFEINRNERRDLRDSQNKQSFSNKILDNFNKYERLNLFKNKNEFVEIPRKDYDKYSLRDTITVGYGMDTGEYKFVGAKTLIKEKALPKGNKSAFSEEEILKEISRRNVKKEKKKRVSYEVVDKFYALTELGGKTIRRIEKNAKKEYNKNDFYSSLRNSSNYNQNNNNNNNNDDFIVVESNDNNNKSYNYNNNNSGYGNYNNKNASAQFNQNNNSDSNRSKSQLNYKLYGYKEEMSSGSGVKSKNNKIINKFSSNNYYNNNYSSNNYSSNKNANKNESDSYFFTTNYQNKNNKSGNNYSSNKFSGNSNSNNYYSSNKYSGNNNASNKYSSSSNNNIINKYSSNNYASNNQSNNNNNNNINNEMGNNNEGAGAYSNGPLDNYSKYLLDQINTIRADPQSFIGVIEDSKANICKDKKGRLIFNGKVKIALTEGESAFNECIEFLKNLEPMEPLEFDPYLTIQPPQNEQEIKDKNDIHKKVDNMINSGVYISSYWKDFVKDPEISFLLMIVDDNGVKSGRKRNDILNPNMKYIGISSAEIKRNFVSYIALR